MSGVARSLTREMLALNATSIREPASAAAISNFERKHGVVMHSEVRVFYTLCNGLVSAGSLLTSIYPIDAVECFFKEETKSRYYIFGDIMLGSDDIAMDFSNPSSPVLMMGADQILVPNFGELLSDFIGDSEIILHSQ